MTMMMMQEMSGSSLTTTDVGTVSLLGSQKAFSIGVLSTSVRVLHVPNTSSSQLGTGSLPLLVDAAAAAASDDDVSFDVWVTDAADVDGLVSFDDELQHKINYCLKNSNLITRWH